MVQLHSLGDIDVGEILSEFYVGNITILRIVPGGFGPVARMRREGQGR